MSETRDIALVTGGAQGIGLASAEAIANEMGARIVIADINAEGAKAAAVKLGNGAVGYACDVGDVNAVLSLFDDIERDIGTVKYLVNNAGIAEPCDFLNTPIEQFKRVIDVNLVGAFAALQRAAKAMVDAGIQGSVVNMSSINAVVSIPSIAAYCASKGGIMQLTKSASLALAPHSIRVNAVGPGSINTDMMAAVNANPEAMQTVLSRTPLKRIGRAEEIGNVVAFLLSSKASYITGETIYVDGGRIGMNYTC